MDIKKGGYIFGNVKERTKTSSVFDQAFPVYLESFIGYGASYVYRSRVSYLLNF